MVMVRGLNLLSIDLNLEVRELIFVCIQHSNMGVGGESKRVRSFHLWNRLLAHAVSILR